jgi:hypothetical protein
MIYRLVARSYRLLPALLLASLLIFSKPSASAEYEAAPVGSASQLLGTASKGPNFEVEDLVNSDGLLRAYTINTIYGQQFVHGDAFLARRLKELMALAILERESSREAFGNAMAKAIGAPLQTAGSLVTKPVKTVKRTVSGLGEMFGRIAAGAAHPGADPDGTASSLLGVSAAKREIAAQLGVDPYTDFLPLAENLERFAKASALGGLTVKLAFSTIPGAAGTIISTGSTTQSVQSLLRDKTPAQLIEHNTAILKKLGVPAKSIKAFLTNKSFTLEDQTVMVSALSKMKGAKNPGIFIARAGATQRRDLAIFIRRRAEMLAAYQQQTSGISAFVIVRGFPLNQLRDGRILLLAPIDSLAWTPDVAGAARAITGDVQRLPGNHRPLLAISGEATPKALAEFRNLGWEVQTGVGL